MDGAALQDEVTRILEIDIKIFTDIKRCLCIIFIIRIKTVKGAAPGIEAPACAAYVSIIIPYKCGTHIAGPCIICLYRKHGYLKLRRSFKNLHITRCIYYLVSIQCCCRFIHISIIREHIQFLMLRDLSCDLCKYFLCFLALIGP